MATTNATINISSDITTYPISISKTMTMKKFQSNVGLEETSGLRFKKFAATTETVVVEQDEFTSTKGCKVYMRNTGTNPAEYFYVAKHASAAASDTDGETIGKPCGSCSGNGKTQSNENVTVKIPKGVDDGTRIRLSGKGEAGSKGGSSGDLYLFISIENHNIFKRSEENLYYELPISFSSAALGITVEVPSIDGGKSKIKIPGGTQHGKQFRLKGKGMPVLRRSIFGDLYIRIVTQVPTALSKRQKEILEEFNEIEANKPDPVIKTFFEKAKKFWKSS